MDDIFFKSTAEFEKAFNIDDAHEYEGYEPLTDCIGFRVQRKYPENIRYKSPKRKDGTDDNIVRIEVIYSHPSEINGAIDPHKIPLTVNVSLHKRYLAHHRNYDFYDENCPTKESLDKSQSLPHPINLEFRDKYFYDHYEKTFRDKKNKSLSGKMVLDRVFQSHFNTVHLFRGLIPRLKLRLRSYSVLLCGITYKVIRWILKYAFGRIILPDDPMDNIFGNYKKDALKFEKGKIIKLFGYEASINVIITLCIIIFTSYSLAYFFKIHSPYLRNILSSPLLSLVIVLLLLWVLDYIVPNLLFKLIIFVLNVRFKAWFYKLK